jgi:hypothetical protein
MKKVSKLFILVFATTLLYSVLKRTLFQLDFFSEPMVQKAIRVGLVVVVLITTLIIYSRTNKPAHHGR